MSPVEAVEDRVTAAQRWRDAKDQAQAVANARADNRRDDRIAEAQESAAARPRPQDKDVPTPRAATGAKAVDILA